MIKRLPCFQCSRPVLHICGSINAGDPEKGIVVRQRHSGAKLDVSSLPEHLFTAAMASALARVTQCPNTKKQLDQHGYFKVEAI
jgi:hypothetical protein